VNRSFFEKTPNFLYQKIAEILIFSFSMEKAARRRLF